MSGRSGAGDLTLETSGLLPADRLRPSDLTLAGSAAAPSEKPAVKGAHGAEGAIGRLGGRACEDAAAAAGGAQPAGPVEDRLPPAIVEVRAIQKRALQTQLKEANTASKRSNRSVRKMAVTVTTLKHEIRTLSHQLATARANSSFPSDTASPQQSAKQADATSCAAPHWQPNTPLLHDLQRKYQDNESKLGQTVAALQDLQDRREVRCQHIGTVLKAQQHRQRQQEQELQQLKQDLREQTDLAQQRQRGLQQERADAHRLQHQLVLAHLQASKPHTAFTLAPRAQAAAGQGSYGEVVFLAVQDRDCYTLAPIGAPRQLALKMASTESGRTQLQNECLKLQMMKATPEGAAAVPYLELEYQQLELPDGAGIVGAIVMEAGLRSVDKQAAMLRARQDHAGLASLMRAMERATGAVQAAFMLHAELKPDNMVVMPDGSVKIIDFGGAQGLESAADLSMEPLTWLVTGVGSYTPGYNQPGYQPLATMQARHGVGRVGLDFDRWSLLVTMLDILDMSPYSGLPATATHAQRMQRVWDYEARLEQIVDNRTLGMGVKMELCAEGCAEGDAAGMGRYVSYIAGQTAV
eukprot:jgi/Tetstr1/436598/TSEL_025395.t1